MSDLPAGEGWWQASDGKWYAPEQRAGRSVESTSETDRVWVQIAGEARGPYPLPEVRTMAQSRQIKSDTLVKLDNSDWFPAQELPAVFSEKTFAVAILLAFFGGFGLDRFYLGYTTLGLLKLFTLGGCLVWLVIDIFLIATRKLPDAKGLPLRG